MTANVNALIEARNTMEDLDAVLTNMVEPFFSKITNSIITIDDISLDIDTENVKLRATQSWQGDAETWPFSFPTLLVVGKINELRQKEAQMICDKMNGES